MLINRLERKYIPNTRHKKWYRKLRNTILIIFVVPFALPIHGIGLFIKFLKKNLRIKRKGKPDIILSNIIAGWANLAFPTKRVEEIAMQRAEICAGCPFAVMMSGTHTITVDGKATNVRGMKCDKCGCPLSAKVRALEDRCPIGKW